MAGPFGDLADGWEENQTLVGGVLFFLCLLLQIPSYFFSCPVQEKSAPFFTVRCMSYCFYMEILIAAIMQSPLHLKCRLTEKEKRQLRLKKLMVDSHDEAVYELGDSIVDVLSAIPRPIEQDKIAQIALGARPITGRMRGR